MNKLVFFGFLLIPFGILTSIDFKNVKIENQEMHFAFHQQKMPGEIIFKKYCISCHQADGGGVPNMAPSLIKASFVLGKKDTLVKIILNGLKNVDIDEKSYNNPMPALGSVLKDQQIADVLTYIRNSFGNKASPVSVTEVKTVRNQN